MITRVSVLDGIEHTFVQPIINTIRDDLNRKIIKDPEAFSYDVGNYNRENVEVTDNTYDNTIGGPVLSYTYEITPDENMRLGTNTYHPLNKIMLLDRTNGFNVRPNYKGIDLTIHFTYKTQSKTLAQRVISNLQAYYDISGYTMAHNLPYSYLIPNNVLALINDIKALRELDMDLMGYIDVISIYKLDRTINRGSNYSVPVFRGVFNNIFGMFEEVPSDVNIEKQDDAYFDVSFSYKVSIKQPYSLTVQYPIIVNNKRIPDRWLPRETIAKQIDHAEDKLDITHVISKYKSFKDNEAAMFHIPTYDNFYPLGYDRADMMRAVSILLEVDPDNPNLLFNINDLRYIGIPDSLINYMSECDSSELFEYHMALVYLELYDGNNKRDLKLYKDEDGNIKTEEPLLITSSYHLVINFITDRSVIYYFSPTNRDETKVERDETLIALYKLPVSSFNEKILNTKLA